MRHPLAQIPHHSNPPAGSNGRNHQTALPREGHHRAAAYQSSAPSTCLHWHTLPSHALFALASSPPAPRATLVTSYCVTRGSAVAVRDLWAPSACSGLGKWVAASQKKTSAVLPIPPPFVGIRLSRARLPRARMTPDSSRGTRDTSGRVGLTWGPTCEGGTAH